MHSRSRPPTAARRLAPPGHKTREQQGVKGRDSRGRPRHLRLEGNPCPHGEASARPRGSLSTATATLRTSNTQQGAGGGRRPPTPTLTPRGATRFRAETAAPPRRSPTDKCPAVRSRGSPSHSRRGNRRTAAHDPDADAARSIRRGRVATAPRRAATSWEEGKRATRQGRN